MQLHEGSEKRSSILQITSLLLLVMPLPMESQMSSTNSRLLTDFSDASPDLRWYVVNDNVMGGRSEGGFDQDPSGLIFEGRTNTDGGGFSSIRTGALELDLSAYSGIRVHARGDGRRYTWRLTSNALWRGQPVSYWAEFDSPEAEWGEVSLPFSAFQPRFRGQTLAGPELDPSQITSMGLMIYDGQDGRFQLFLGRIEAYLD